MAYGGEDEKGRPIKLCSGCKERIPLYTGKSYCTTCINKKQRAKYAEERRVLQLGRTDKPFVPYEELE